MELKKDILDEVRDKIAHKDPTLMLMRQNGLKDNGGWMLNFIDLYLYYKRMLLKLFILQKS
ncbi:hypothetical protein H5J22_00770 [Cetobacterium sp. 8H]|uniref:hypothetical protein n=1 Tax=Cetobacterium sp. 8H TaxID=2759681 RepID=UPI00163C8A0C|nr:hypothetical protein [Cetobacterium sp. 8H]MBC2849993.1 hypothetical protein [Cetobacterium sp. 8H]